MRIFASVFVQNSGRVGGAIYSKYSLELLIGSSTFLTNAARSGGAIAVKGVGDGGPRRVKMGDVLFSGNKASSGGEHESLSRYQIRPQD